MGNKYVVPRKFTGRVPAAFRRSAEWPFSYAVDFQQLVDWIPERWSKHTVDARSKRYIRVVCQRLGNVGVSAVRILVFLQSLQYIMSINMG